MSLLLLGTQTQLQITLTELPFLTYPLLNNFYYLPGGASGKEPDCQYRRCQRLGFNPWVRKIPWRREWLPTPILLPGGVHGWRSLEGYNPGVAKSQMWLKWLRMGYPLRCKEKTVYRHWRLPAPRLKSNLRQSLILSRSYSNTDLR